MTQPTAKNITVIFFKVEIEHNRRLEHYFDEILQLDEAEQRCASTTPPVRVQRLEKHGAIYSGDLMKIREGEPAFLGNRRGVISPVAMAAGLGVGELVAFRYDATTGGLALQRNKYAFGPSVTAQVFKELSGFSEDVQLHPLLRLNAYQRFQSIQHFREFRCRIAKPADHAALMTEDSALSDLLKAADAFSAPSLDFAVTRGRERTRWLDRPTVRRVVQVLLPWMDNGVLKKLEVGGVDDNDDLVEPVDFLKTRFEASKKLVLNCEYDPHYLSRRNLLEELTRRHQAELNNLLLPAP